MLGELAQHLSASAEIMSRTLGESPRERAQLAHSIEKESARASAVHRRICNRLATSLITPFEADGLFELSFALEHAIEGIEHAMATIVSLTLGTLPTPLMEALAIIERMAELSVQGCWELGDSVALAGYSEEMRRVQTHARTLTRQALVLVLAPNADPIMALREREAVRHIEMVVQRLGRIAKATELLRVKGA